MVAVLHSIRQRWVVQIYSARAAGVRHALMRTGVLSYDRSAGAQMQCIISRPTTQLSRHRT